MKSTSCAGLSRPVTASFVAENVPLDEDGGFEGKVVAETGAASVAVDAGRKAILTPDKQPSVTVDDSMVDDVMEICKWAEQESQAQRQVIDATSVLNIKMEDEHLFTMAYFAEMRNENSEPSTVCPLSLSSLYEEPRFYDLQGNLLQFDLEKVDAERGYYTLHFSSPVEQGGSFKYILVSRSPRGLSAWKDGPIWHLRPNVGDPHKLLQADPAEICGFRGLQPPSGLD